MRLRIRGARVLTQDEGRRIVEGDVVAQDGVIESVGGTAKGRFDETLDGRGRLLIPGLVNTHTHLPMVLFRGWGDDLPLGEWLRTRIWPAEERMKEEDMRVGTRLAALEMIAGGSTTFNDMYFFEEAIAQEAEKAGLRGWAGFGMVDVGKVGPEEENPKMDECERFVKNWAKKSLVRAAPAPHAPNTCGPKTYARSHRIAKTYDTVLHTHLSETRDEVYSVETERGARPPAYLAKAGALSDRTILAHCGWITKDEVRAIAAAKAKVSHNPVSNMKLATGGACPVPELLDAGAAVGLGTDGGASNNTLDLFQTMKFTSLLHKHLRWDAKLLPAQTVFDLATRGGAQALRLGDSIGSIEVGKRADLALVSLAAPRMRPLHDPVSQLVYAAEASDVEATIIDGKVLYAEREFRSLKADRILDEADKAGARLVGGSAAQK